MNHAVYALEVFDDGTGPALFAGGEFTTAGGVSANRIAKWDGTSWSALGSGLGSYVYALEVFDDGTGTALFAGGNRLWKRLGKVFDDRFYDRVLRTPREVRNALAYVLDNARRHGVVIGPGEPDPFSSGRWFDGWGTWWRAGRAMLRSRGRA